MKQDVRPELCAWDEEKHLILTVESGETEDLVLERDAELVGVCGRTRQRRGRPRDLLEGT